MKRPLKASIICIGTELTTGKNLDTNSQYLARQLFKLGIYVSSLTNIPDDLEMIKKHIRAALKENHFVICTGGLGPTQDDITKDAVRDVLHLKTEYSEEIYSRIRKYFKKRKIPLPQINASQSLIFIGSKVIPNQNGTAPGFIIERKKKSLCLLPGPPNELIPMFEKEVIPYLKKKNKIDFYHSVFRFYGLGESYIAQKMTPIHTRIKKLNGDITFLSNPNLTDIIVSTRDNIKAVEKESRKIRSLFKENLYAEKYSSIYSVVAGLFKKRKMTISTAESCTGGLLDKVLTDSPGSSEFFQFGIISYSNRSKMRILNVPKKDLDRFGAVSREVAGEMLKGLDKIIQTDVAVAVTGIAGPSGGTKEKPVGLVYIGIRLKKKVEIIKFLFMGNREQIRLNTVNKVFELLHRKLK
ncbi:MAG: competence/damage-inducible protein A [Spirochaetes bacterium]|nr:competence/damage-inducible protein A [Spirochaetota bacterium]